MDKQLKPCPFCGYKKARVSERRKQKHIPFYKGLGYSYDYETIYNIRANVICNKCHAKGGTAVGNIQGEGNVRESTKERFKIEEYEAIKQRAIEAWNRRVDDGREEKN